MGTNIIYYIIVSILLINVNKWLSIGKVNKKKSQQKYTVDN